MKKGQDRTESKGETIGTLPTWPVFPLRHVFPSVINLTFSHTPTGTEVSQSHRSGSLLDPSFGSLTQGCFSWTSTDPSPLFRWRDLRTKPSFCPSGSLHFIYMGSSRRSMVVPSWLRKKTSFDRDRRVKGMDSVGVRGRIIIITVKPRLTVLGKKLR